MKLKVKFKEESAIRTKFSCDDQIFYPVIGEIASLTGLDYTTLHNKPSINGVELIGDKTSEDLHLGSAVFPSGGVLNDLLGITSEGIGWITPANAVEEDNTRPITAAAVYTEVGNINVLLQTI